MSADNEPTEERLDLPYKWVGFEPGKRTYDVEHDLTLDDLVASLVSDKNDPDKNDPPLIRTVELRVQVDFGECILHILVRTLTQIYTPCESVDTPGKIENYCDFPEWAIEGWILMNSQFDPSWCAPSVRCYFQADKGGSLLEATVQFINTQPSF